MKRFIFVLLSLLCMLSVQAQLSKLDNASFSFNTVVPQADVGTVIETTYTNIYSDYSVAPVMVTTTTVSNYFKYAPTVTNTSCTITDQGYTSGRYYQRDVGWQSNTLYLTSTTIRNDTQPNYKNIQKYYCY